MTLQIHSSWEKPLQTEFESLAFKQLIAFLKTEYSTHRCYPPKNQIFNAFEYCPFDRVKVILLGQDPYHGMGQAQGLSFSVPKKTLFSHSSAFPSTIFHTRSPFPYSPKSKRRTSFLFL